MKEAKCLCLRLLRPLERHHNKTAANKQRQSPRQREDVKVKDEKGCES